MPAIDQCEPAVIRALEKEGWSVADQPYSIKTGGRTSRYVHADLLFEYHSKRTPIIVVEVKCFPKGIFSWDEFYSAIGQYVVYRTALRLSEILYPLYLVFPLHIQETFSVEYPLAPLVLDEIDVKLITVDLVLEEVVQWKH